MSKLSKSLKKVSKSQKESVWEGPMSNGPQGGITQSLLSTFMVCRERFRLRVVEGLTSAEGFNHRLEYGSMWHVCEEEYARTKGQDDNWERALLQYAKILATRYRTQQEQVEKWYHICKVQFPVYLRYWKEHQEKANVKTLFAEKVFNVPYDLPSGRIVYLRGKFDAVEILGSGSKVGLYLKENKTKGDIDEPQLKKQLTFDLQVMLYLVALTKLKEATKSGVLIG